MHAHVGMFSPMVITARHLAKRAPSWKYSCRRLRNPSRPSVTFSPGCSAMSCAPPSTLMPGMMPFFFMCSAKGVPSRVFCLSVSSKRMTPLTNSAAPGVVNRSSRYARRFSSLHSTLTESKRFLHVPALSSAASRPLPGATMARAVSPISLVSIVSSLCGCGILVAAALLADLHDLHRVGSARLADGLADREDDEIAGLDDAVGDEHRFGLGEKLVAIVADVLHHQRVGVAEERAAIAREGLCGEGVDGHAAIEARHPQ